MNVNVLDLCYQDPEIELWDEEELFGGYSDKYEGDIRNISGWDLYIENLNNNNLDGIIFKKADIKLNTFIIDDGGELIKLKNGQYWNICWRYHQCRIWLEEDEKQIKYLNKKLQLK